MARTIGRALPHKLPSMANAYGLLLGRGVWAMSYNCSSCVIRGIGLCFHISVGDRESEQVGGYCVDCGELYELNALDLDLRCADCVEQLALDKQEGESMGSVWAQFQRQEREG